MTDQTNHTINMLAALCENRLANLNLDGIHPAERLTIAESVFINAARNLRTAHLDWVNEFSDEAMVDPEKPWVCVCGNPTNPFSIHRSAEDGPCYSIYTSTDVADAEANAEVGW
jgi:hypothetical protein